MCESWNTESTKKLIERRERGHLQRMGSQDLGGLNAKEEEDKIGRPKMT